MIFAVEVHQHMADGFGRVADEDHQLRLRIELALIRPLRRYVEECVAAEHSQILHILRRDDLVPFLIRRQHLLHSYGCVDDVRCDLDCARPDIVRRLRVLHHRSRRFD